MSPNEIELMEKIRQLPPEKRTEVEEFVDFVTQQGRRLAAFDRLLAIAPALQAAGVSPTTEDEAVALVRQVRAERRARQDAQDADAPSTPRP